MRVLMFCQSLGILGVGLAGRFAVPSERESVDRIIGGKSLSDRRPYERMKPEPMDQDH